MPESIPSTAPTVLMPPESESRPCERMDIQQAFPSAIAALQEYQALVRNPRAELHPQRVCAILSDFGNGMITRETYKAALLHDIGQTVTSEKGALHWQNSKRILKQYASTDEDWEYVATLLSDLDVVEDYSERNRAEQGVKSEALVKILGSKSIGAVEKDLWLEQVTLTKPSTMLELLNGVNVESVLIKSAEMLDNIIVPSQNERALLRDIHDAESFYAPICEIMGMDGLASALRSQANIIRLRKAGYGSYVTEAQHILNKLGDRGEVLGKTERLLGQLALGDVDVDHAFHDTTGHGITLGTAELQMAGSKDTIRAIWRIKSVGSLAMKLLREDLEWAAASDEEIKQSPALLQGRKRRTLPADILGITIVASNTSEVADVFKTVAIAAYDNESIELTTSPSRAESNKKLHIQGGTQFSREVSGAVLTDESNRRPAKRPNRTIVKIKASDIAVPPVKPNDPKPFEVAKLTCKFEEARTEIQVMTEANRIGARIGLAAHVIYKLRKQLKHAAVKEAEVTVTPEDMQALGAIYDRMREFRAGIYTLKDESVKRGNTFRIDVNRANIQNPSKRAMRRAGQTR